MTTAASITVRVQSLNGKFLGDDIGGAHVSIRDVRSRKVLAEGVTRGDNGELSTNWEPGALLATVLTDGKIPTAVWLHPRSKTAAFTASLDIVQPTELEITVYGPLAGLQSASRITTEQAIAPGQDIRDVVFKLQGLIVQVMNPPTHAGFPSSQAAVTIAANVTLMCGCPISTKPFAHFAVPLWRPSEFDVVALVRVVGDRSYTKVPLAYVPESTSHFSAMYAAQRPGDYEATIVAYQASTGNLGLGRVAWTLHGRT
jgi:hypothetical protein